MITVHQPSLTDRARWAVALYVENEPPERTLAQNRDRQAGIRRYKHAPAARLRADLEPVLQTYPDGTVQYSAAAYVLARYGVDTERNTARLFDSGRMDRKGDDPEGNAESLPEALGDLWVVRHSPTALRLLLTMPSDGAISEIQADEIVRALGTAPNTVLRAASRSRRGWDALAFGVTVNGVPNGLRMKETTLLARLSRDAKRAE